TGDYIQKGVAIYEIADLSRVWILFDVYESDISWIKKGDQVSFTVASLPGEEFNGTISYLDPVIDPKTRVAKARIEFSNRSLKLKPEMFVSGVVKAGLNRTAHPVVVPKSAVMWTGKRSIVYIKSTTDQGVNFIMREVTLGPSLGDSYIIESGLEEGEEIAVSGTFSIDASAQLAGKASMMSPEGGVKMTGHDHGSGTPMEMETTTQEPVNKSIVTITETAREALKPLYNSYLDLTENLANDNFKKASEAGIEMKDALGEINMKLFKDDAHNIWMDHAANLESALEHVAHYNSIEKLRAAYKEISDAMIALSRSFGTSADTLYVQYCPMANNDKGANWLSKTSEIRNPYFGDMMLTCGETHDTIH
ncbi:MAG: efflux RND transporter periplasmic adaptor subunit, partial [Bacteroidales bacterium]